MTNLVIMFDGIKINISGTSIHSILSNPLLNFDQHLDRFGNQTRTAMFQGMEVKVCNERIITIKGSIHKYYNNGRHNHNTFTLSDFTEVLSDLCEKLQINPFLASLHNLEFGVNVLLPFDTKEFIQCLVSFKGKDFDKRIFKNRGYLYSYPFDHYSLKIYDKGLQYNLPQNVLRFEVAVKRMQFFKNKGIQITHLSDLTNPGTYPLLKQIILAMYNEMLVYEPSAIMNCHNMKERELILQGANPLFWVRLQKNNPENFKKKRSRFRSLISKYRTESIKQEVGDLISKIRVTEPTSEEMGILVQYLNQYPEGTFPELTGSLWTWPKEDFPRINGKGISVIQGQEERKCATCGRDISKQKKGSRFCSELSNGKEVKRCRNLVSNRKVKEKRLYSGDLLFSLQEFPMRLPG